MSSHSRSRLVRLPSIYIAASISQRQMVRRLLLARDPPALVCSWRIEETRQAPELPAVVHPERPDVEAASPSEKENCECLRSAFGRACPRESRQREKSIRRLRVKSALAAPPGKAKFYFGISISVSYSNIFRHVHLFAIHLSGFSNTSINVE